MHLVAAAGGLIAIASLFVCLAVLIGIAIAEPWVLLLYVGFGYAMVRGLRNAGRK